MFVTFFCVFGPSFVMQFLVPYLLAQEERGLIAVFKVCSCSLVVIVVLWSLPTGGLCWYLVYQISRL